MYKKMKLFTTALLTVLMVSGLLPQIGYAAESDFSVNAKAAISIDFETGKVFYNQNADKPMGIASVSKIISIYLVEEAIENGDLNWDDEVEISEYAAELSVDPDLSNVPLDVDTTYTVQELYEAALIQSANAAIVALAEHIAGSEPKFVDMMQEKLQSWGIDDATVVNSSGLNNEYLGDNIYPGSKSTDENLLSAKDVAIVARHLINDYPDVLETTSTPTKMFGEDTNSPVEMVNWNWMLPGFVNEKEGVDGLKTGTTDKAGACFVGTMLKDDQRIITVVLNATNHETDPSARFVETSNLMDYTFENWEQTEVETNNQKVKKLNSVAVVDGKEETVPVKMDGDTTVWVRSDMDDTNLAFDASLTKKIAKNDGIQAPSEKGKKVGTTTVQLAEDDLGYVDDADIPTTDLVTTKEMDKANFFVLIGRQIQDFFTNLF